MQVEDPLTVVTSIANPSVACELRILVERLKTQATTLIYFISFVIVFPVCAAQLATRSCPIAPPSTYDKQSYGWIQLQRIE